MSTGSTPISQPEQERPPRRTALIFVLTLPLVVVTLGLFVLVINAGLLLLVGTLVKGFEVNGFWPG